MHELHLNETEEQVHCRLMRGGTVTERVFESITATELAVVLCGVRQGREEVLAGFSAEERAFLTEAMTPYETVRLQADRRCGTEGG